MRSGLKNGVAVTLYNRDFFAGDTVAASTGEPRAQCDEEARCYLKGKVIA